MPRSASLSVFVSLTWRDRPPVSDGELGEELRTAPAERDRIDEDIRSTSPRQHVFRGGLAEPIVAVGENHQRSTALGVLHGVERGHDGVEKAGRPERVERVQRRVLGVPVRRLGSDDFDLRSDRDDHRLVGGSQLTQEYPARPTWPPGAATPC